MIPCIDKLLASFFLQNNTSWDKTTCVVATHHPFSSSPSLVLWEIFILVATKAALINRVGYIYRSGFKSPVASKLEILSKKVKVVNNCPKKVLIFLRCGKVHRSTAAYTYKIWKIGSVDFAVCKIRFFVSKVLLKICQI